MKATEGSRAHIKLIFRFPYSDFYYLLVLFHIQISLDLYSGVPITRAGSIKRAGRIFLQILINEQVLIRASRLEKIKILAVKLQSGRNFHDIFKNEQALLRASRLENDQKFLVRACSLNRHTRVFS